MNVLVVWLIGMVVSEAIVLLLTIPALVRHWGKSIVCESDRAFLAALFGMAGWLGIVMNCLMLCMIYADEENE